MAILVSAASYGTLLFFARTSIQVDNKIYTHYALQKGTVAELLQSFEVRLSSKDIVRPSLNEKIHWGEKVQVVRVKETAAEENSQVDFVLEWKRRTSKNLRKVEIQQGYRQNTVWTIQHIFHDGKEVETKKKVKKIDKEPVKRLVFLNKRDYPIKIYDLSKFKKLRLTATAYWVGDPQVPGTITYSGHRVKRGLVAVDPNIIPLGMRLYIPGYGYAYSSDTGSAIKGKRIDLFVENKTDSRNWEYKKVDVYILERSKTW